MQKYTENKQFAICFGIWLGCIIVVYVLDYVYKIGVLS